MTTHSQATLNRTSLENQIFDSQNSGNHATPDFSDIQYIVDFTEWQVYSDDAPLVDYGDIIFCECDFTGEQYEARFMGWWEDYSLFGEKSPYEFDKGIERLYVIRLDNGSPDTPLPEFTRHESQVNINHAITAKMD